MDEILELLENSRLDEEATHATHLRHHTTHLLTQHQSSQNQPLTTTLLIEVIKPLFSKSHHPSITPAGRKNLFSPPSVPTPFNDNDSIFGPPPPWKTPWTIPLLNLILDLYKIDSNSSSDLAPSRKLLENDFHLLAPPLLHLLDDADLSVKTSACHSLASLCDSLVTAQSDIPKRTGLAEVFLDTLRGCFHYLPSLTGEEESLGLLKGVYVAWMGVVRARFQVVERLLLKNGSEKVENKSNAQKPEDEDIPTIVPLRKQSTTTSSPKPKSTPKPPPLTSTQISKDLTSRTTHLTTLLRHSLLHTISHLRTSSEAGTTTSIPITTFLLTQLGPILTAMNIDASTHLRSIVPMLVSILRDPFVTAAPEMLGTAVGAVEAVVCCCWERVRGGWWLEILRGLVDGWMNCEDEVGDLKGRDGEKRSGLEAVMKKVKHAVSVLGDVVGEEFWNVAEVLVVEEPGLERLFGNRADD